MTPEQKDDVKVEKKIKKGDIIEQITLKEVNFNFSENKATHPEFKRQLEIQEKELNLMLVKDWLTNRYVFMRRAITKGEGSDPKGDKEITELRESIRRDITDNYYQ